MIDSLDEEEYPSSFPLEKIISHLKISLKLLENAHMQWMSEKESLIHELERLRMENRALRMEVRNNENIERNSVASLVTPIGSRKKSYYVIDQETGKFIKLSPTNSINLLNRVETDIRAPKHVIDVKNEHLMNYTDVTGDCELGSVYLNKEHISSPIQNFQNCRVRKIKLEDEQSDHDSMDTGESKYVKDDSEKKSILATKNLSLEQSNNNNRVSNVNLVNVNNSAGSNSNNKNEIKYKEVGKSIGKRDSRNNLQAFECNECSKFYKAINSKQVNNNQTICKHMKQNYLLQNSGRHRYKNQPTKSPPGFWDIDDL